MHEFLYIRGFPLSSSNVSSSTHSLNFRAAQFEKKTKIESLEFGGFAAEFESSKLNCLNSGHPQSWALLHHHEGRGARVGVASAFCHSWLLSAR